MQDSLGLLMALQGGDGSLSREGAKPIPEAVSDTLMDRFAVLMEKHDFAPGDLVTMKPGWENRREPWKGQPMIVVDTDTSDYAALRGYGGGPPGGIVMNVDVVTATLDPDGQCSMRGYDRRMLTPWSPKADSKPKDTKAASKRGRRGS